ncbi:MAG: hypothetical protein LC104_06805 [Bacteroidales bacterium]|nr:hypothetical protein [Bacteroidales bacterium]
MKKSQIQTDCVYVARVSGRLVTVRVDRIRDTQVKSCTGFRDATLYDVTNLKTMRKLVFRSATKFRGPAKDTE